MIDYDLQRAWALKDAAQALTRARRIEQGLQTAGGIDDPKERAEALNGGSQALAETGQAERAVQVAVDIDDPHERTAALRQAVAALVQAGQAGQAADVARQALQAAASIASPQLRAQAAAALLSNPAIRDSDPEGCRRALELILFTSSAPDHLAAFPVALLQRLIASGYLEP